MSQPKTGLIEERPTKPHDASCGELLDNMPNHDPALPRMIQQMCVDGSHCQFNPTTMRQTENGRWIAVCTIHNNE